MAGGDPGQHLGHLVPDGRVAARQPDLGPQRGEFGGQFAGAGRGVAAPGGEHQVPHAVRGDQVPCDHRAQRAGAARDEHGAAGCERTGDGEHDPADVPAPAHGAHRVPGAADVEHGAGRRRQHAALEQRQQRVEHGADPLRSRLDEVERLVADAGVAPLDLPGGPDVGLAHLDEPAAAGQQSQ
ncbi:hypothetical protein AN220_03530 [Streptomyces nanshensis]|nr:hypothetical protein AN220_03530 [Streptomyces nanshensis]